MTGMRRLMEKILLIFIDEKEMFTSLDMRAEIYRERETAL